MACNCGKGRLASAAKYEVVTPSGTTEHSSEAAAKIAAARSGGVVRPKQPATP